MILDSLVYRDLLNGSKLAKDSSTVAEFNRIAATNRAVSSDFETNLLNEGLSAKEYNKIRDCINAREQQFLSDKILYGKLFKEKGLMTKDFAKRFLAVSRFADPSVEIGAYQIKSEEREIREGELLELGISLPQEKNNIK